MKERTAPDIELTMPVEGYAALLYAGYDWWAEAMDYVMPQTLWNKFRDHKDAARRLDDRLKTPIEVKFGKEQFQIMPTGAAGGKEFVVFNDDIRFEFSSIHRTWSTCWRATAVALAKYGVEAIRDRVYLILEREGFTEHPDHFEGDEYIKVTRFDFAFDVLSEDFTREMVPSLANTIVTPSEVKTRGDFWSRGHDKGKGEAALKTLTIGSKKGCQVQIYHKLDEITELSGKDWMFDQWAASGQWSGETEVWRIECRFAGQYLKERTKKDPETILDNIAILVSDALYNRRITVPNESDSNRRRWPMHPLFSFILEEIESPRIFLPVNRFATGKKDKLKEVIIKNISGSLRSTAVLSDQGLEMDIDGVREIAEQAVLHMFSDPEHMQKIKKSQERYKLINKPS